VVPATIAAIELLIESLETPPPAPPDWPVIRPWFAALRDRFATLTGVSGPPTAHPAECRVLKVVSSYRPPPPSYWREVRLDLQCDPRLLSRRHADAEYLIHRLPSELLDLCAEAGSLLPFSPEVPDRPVLFSPSHGEPPPVVNPDPVARWMRFVFNTKGVADRQLFRSENHPAEVYGHANLPGGILVASVRAIELAGLLPNPSAVAANAAPTSRPATKKTKGKGIEAQMLKLLHDKPHEVVGWSASQWAFALGCAASTVKETDTWKDKLMAAKALDPAERVARKGLKRSQKAK
jgi:hypothetical protein